MNYQKQRLNEKTWFTSKVSDRRGISSKPKNNPLPHYQVEKSNYVIWLSCFKKGTYLSYILFLDHEKKLTNDIY